LPAPAVVRHAVAHRAVSDVHGRSNVNRRHTPRSYARLTQPLVRHGGALRPASWDEALDRAAAGFRCNIDAGGPDAAGIFSCSKSTNEVNFLAQKLARVVFRTNNIDSCNRT
jgi:formate dehydrogenase major subunit